MPHSDVGASLEVSAVQVMQLDLGRNSRACMWCYVLCCWSDPMPVARIPHSPWGVARDPASLPTS
jgi:hypothetical protein